ncbi:hypothetical protein J6590_044458, partial [Homalodisca vitripennis]
TSLSYILFNSQTELQIPIGIHKDGCKTYYSVIDHRVWFSLREDEVFWNPIGIQKDGCKTHYSVIDHRVCFSLREDEVVWNPFGIHKDGCKTHYSVIDHRVWYPLRERFVGRCPFCTRKDSCKPITPLRAIVFGFLSERTIKSQVRESPFCIHNEYCKTHYLVTTIVFRFLSKRTKSISVCFASRRTVVNPLLVYDLCTRFLLREEQGGRNRFYIHKDGCKSITPSRATITF